MTDLPSSLYDGTVERTADGGVIRFERRLPFPIRDVWDAITNPARLADWWLPFAADITVDLREAGLVVVRPEAQRRVYALNPEPLAELDAWLEPYRRLWSDRLDALERHLDGSAGGAG